jgi:hypothetical protein
MSDVDVIIKVHTQGVSEIGNLSSSLRNLSTTLRGISVPMAKLDVQSRAVNKALGVTSRGVDQHAKSIKALVQNQKVLGAESKRIAQDLKGLQNAYALAGRETTALGRSIGYTTKEFQQFSRTFRGLRLKALGSDFSNVSLKLTKLGKDAQFVGRSLMINLTLPLATFGRIGLQNLVKVEKEMTRLTKVMEDLAPTMEIARQKILGVDAANKQMLNPQQNIRARQMVKNFDDMNKAITDLSIKFAVSKDLVASLGADFAELGLTSEQNVTKITELTLQIEKLGNMEIGPSQDLAQALYFQSKRALENSGALAKLTSARDREARAISSSITQMQLFNAIENATALTLRDLGQAFPELGSMATSFGLSMTEAAALLAPMKAAGLDVGASANSIKVSLQRALAPTKQNSDMLARLAKQYSVASDKQNEFALSTKSGIVGLEAIVKVFGRVYESSAGMEGALKLMSDMFEKRQGPRMYLAIEQLHAFNKELAQTGNYMGQLPRRTQTAEVQLALVAEGATKGFSNFNTTVVPKTIRSFGDISKVARIATAIKDQEFEFEPGIVTKVTQSDINNAKLVRAEVSKYILDLKQSQGIDVISEVKSEAGRALMVQLAGSANAAAVAQSELDRSLATTGVAIEKIKNAFKLFAADIIGKLAPAIGKLADKVVELYNKWTGPGFAKTREAITSLILSVGSFLAVMGPIILAFGTFNSVVGKLGLGLARFFPKLKNAENGFVGLGKTAKIASASINDLYKNFVKLAQSRDPSALPGVPRAGAIGLRLPRAPTPRDTKKLLDAALKTELANAKLSSKAIADARKEFSAGVRASKFITAGGGVLPVTGATGARLRPSVVRALRLMEARELADVMPSPTGVLRSPVTGRMIGGPLADRERMLAGVRRQRSIFDRTRFFEEQGISTDRMGTRFVRRGRDITESQANRIARGGLGGVRERIGIAAQAGRTAIASGVTATRDVLSTVRTAAAAAPSTGAGVVRGAGAGVSAIFNQTKAWQAATGGVKAYTREMEMLGGKVNIFGKLKAGVTGLTSTFKIATLASRAFKIALLMTGVGAVVMGIAAVVFLVVKNMDKIRGATAGWNALKDVFDIIKSAIGEIIRPIQDMLAAFGSGGDGAASAGDAIAKAFIGIAKAIKFVANLFKVFVVNVIQPLMYSIVNIVMAVISLFKGNWADAMKFLIAAFAGFAKAVINFGVSMAQGLVSLVVLAINSILGIFAKIPGIGKIVGVLQTGVKKLGDGVKGVYGAVGKGLTGLLDKGLALGIKQSEGKIKVDKKIPGAAKDKGQEAGEAMGNSFGDGFDETDPGAKVAKAIEEGIDDAIQKLQDYVAGRLGDALKKFVSETVKALNKQKESALKVFDVQINTLMKLEKAEESLTKKKQYETTRRKLIDDAALRQENYRRDRALAIYEGRIDDARILDLEERSAQRDTETEIGGVDEDRRKDLAKENLDALRTAIGEAKDLASKFFDESVEKFQQAAEYITRIAPVTIEDYTAQLEQLRTLTMTYADNNNAEFGAMFQKFSTTIAEKMPNTVDDFGKALGAFAGPLDELVNLAMRKYGLGSADEATVLGVTQKMSDAVVGLTLGMLIDIGDTFATSAPVVIEKYGGITGGISSKTGLFKDNVIGVFKTLVEETKTAFLTPFQAALDAAEPTKVFNEAIIDGNQEILNSFRMMVKLNPELMEKLGNSLNPAIKKYIELKAAMDAVAGAAGGGGGGVPLPNPYKGTGYVVTPYGAMPSSTPGVRTVMPLMDRLRQGAGTAFSGESLVLGNMQMFGFKTGGYVPGMPSVEIPAKLHGGEYVINSKSVQQLGLPFLNAMNSITGSKFRAPSSSVNMPSTGGSNQISNINIQVENFIGEEEWFKSMMKSYSVNVAPKNRKLAGVESRTFTSYNGINQGM